MAKTQTARKLRPARPGRPAKAAKPARARKPVKAARKKAARPAPGRKARPLARARATPAPPPESARLDFGRLDLQDALDLAILIEEEALERYQKLAALVGGRYAGDAGDVFRAMQQNEARHGAQLAERRAQLFREARRRVSPAQLFDVEAPDFGKIGVFMSARQAMEVALEAEEKAFAFFDQALPHVKDPAVRKLFEDLRGEEAQHQALLRGKLKGLPPGPDLEPEDADEPGSDPG